MKKILQIIATPLAAIVIVLSGFVYDVLLAGIPYQDATPALQARYDFHSAVAGWFYATGGTMFLIGLIAIPIILKKTKPRGVNKPLQNTSR